MKGGRHGKERALRTAHKTVKGLHDFKGWNKWKRANLRIRLNSMIIDRGGYLTQAPLLRLKLHSFLPERGSPAQNYQATALRNSSSAQCCCARHREPVH